MNAHAEIKELLAIYDRLTEDERKEANAHVAACAECAAELAAWRRMDRGLRYLPDPAPSAALRERLPLPQPVSLARETAPQRRPPAPPPPPITPQPELAPRAPFPWQRLLLPVGLVLLFVASIWLGLRDTSRGPTTRVATPERPAQLPASPQPGLTPEPGLTTITFACEDVAAVYKDYAAIARAFERENPDITITLKSYRDLIGNQSLSYTQTMQEIAASADAFCVWDVAPLVETHLLYNLDALASRDASFEIDDFYTAVLDSARYENILYAIPGRFQPALIRYNPDIFDDAGLAYPQPGWTWDDFAATAKALTLRENGNTQRWGYSEDRPAVFRGRLAEALADPAFAAAARSDAPLADAAVVELFRWYEDLYVNDRSAFPPSGGSGEYSGYTPGSLYTSQIARGKLAMWTDQLYEGARRQGKPAPIPASGSEGGAPIYLGATWAIAAETLHPDATWRWLNYLSRNPPPDSRQMLPTRRSLVEKAAFWQSLPPDEAAVYRYVLDHLAPRPNWLQDPQAMALYEQLGRVARNEISVAELQARTVARLATAAAPLTGAVTITFAAPRDDLAAYRDAAAAFSAQNGTARVEVVAREDLINRGRAETTTLWSEMREIARRVDALAGPEVAALVRSGRAESALYDLTEQMEDAPADSFYPNMLESLQWRGRQWALPDRVSPSVIYYNQWMFDQMGIAYPETGWTWADFARIAEAVTRQGEDKIKWWGVKDGLENQLVILQAVTGSLVDYSVSPAKPLLDQPAVIDGAQRYADLLRKGFLTVPDMLLPGVGAQTASLYAVEAPDDAAMWVGLAEFDKLSDLKVSGIGAVPLPVTNPSGDTPVEIQNALAVSASSPNPDAAWAWINFLSTYGTTDARGPGVSARRSFLMSADRFDEYTLDIYQNALLRSQRAAPLRTEEYYAQRALWAAVDRIAQGEDAATVLKEAQAQAETAISR